MGPRWIIGKLRKRSLVPLPRPVAFHLTGGERRELLGVGPLLKRGVLRTSCRRAVLVAAVLESVSGAARTADLFAGLGTFALALPGQVHAAEAARDAVLALKAARPSLAVEHRDLYRRPLSQ